jgi:hypothetical protein
LGSSPFARHYSGSRGFFPFLWVLRCFSSPACLLLPYVFRQGYARITTREFPHSEIPGSKVGQHLPGAYRSRPRPSSALGAKASTVCPYSLDQKEHVYVAMEFSRCARTRARRTETASAPVHSRHLRGLSKLNSVTLCSPPESGLHATRSTLVPGEPGIRTSSDRAHRRAGRLPR